MAASPAYLEQVREVLRFVPELSIKRMFGGAGAWTGEMMFALIIDDELHLKAEEATRPLFEAEGCHPWVYTRDGVSRDMGYMRAPDIIWDDEDEARRWVGMAIEAAARKFKPKKPKKTR